MSHRFEKVKKNTVILSLSQLLYVRLMCIVLALMKDINSQVYDLAFAEGGSKTHTFLVTCFIFLVCRRGLGVQSAHTVPISPGGGASVSANGSGLEAAALVTDDT